MIGERSMTQASALHKLVLPLATIDELFIAPPYDPMAGKYEEMSGLDRIVAEFKAPVPDPGELVLIVPAEHVHAGLEVAVRTAIAGVCEARIQDLDQQRRAIRLLGRRELVFGLLFLAICLLIAILLEATISDRAFLGRFLVEGVVIIGWIALWHPVDMLIYDSWPVDRDTRIYERIRDLPVRIETAQSSL